MMFLAIIGAIAILLCVVLVILFLANISCQPYRADNAAYRMANRAKRETEQMLYKMASGVVLAIVFLIVYLFVR